MQIRLRVSPYGKIPEIYRGKRTAFADVEGGFANIDTKGDIVGDDAHLTLPYRNDIPNDDDCNDQYKNMMRKMTQQVARMLYKKEHAMQKRGHVSTTRDKKTPTVTNSNNMQIVIKKSKVVDCVEDDHRSKVIDVDVDSMMTSMFSQVGEFDMSELLKHLETSRPSYVTVDEDAEENEPREDEDEEEEEEEEDDVEEEDEEEEEADDSILHHEAFDEDEEEEHNIIATLYKDGKVIKTGPLDDELPEEEVEEDEDEQEPIARTQRKRRSVPGDEDGEESSDDVAKIIDDDNETVFAHTTNDLLADDIDDFDMYDGLADVYEEED